jgi:hypothetical protein
MSEMPCSATVAERLTDAGTRELIPDPGHVDDKPYDEEAQKLERYYALRELVVATLRAAIASVEESRRG